MIGPQNSNESMFNKLASSLFEIGKLFSDGFPLQESLNRVTKHITTLCSADACSILLLDKSSQVLLGKAAHGLARADISALSFRVGQGIAGWVAMEKKPALVKDARLDARYVALKGSSHRIRSLACVPLLYRQELIGVLTVTSKATEAFTGTTVGLLSFIAQTIAMDVQNIRLKRLSQYDPLTGLLNRNFLKERLFSVFNDCVAKNAPISAFLIDIDHFKRINDTLGHLAGDKVLVSVARKLEQSIRCGDYLLRYGGEEFLVILPFADENTANITAKRVLEKFQAPLGARDENSVNVRISLGLTSHKVGDTPKDMIGRADNALYLAKRKGRNRIEIAA